MEKGKDMMNEQREGSALFSIAIMVLTAVVWMSLDIYLPALPVLQEEFSVSASYLNLTLTVGIVTTAVGTLVGGPFSDKYGRKPVFMLGALLSVLFTFLCTFAGGVEFLIVVRCCRIGERDNTTVTTAMIKGFVFGDKVQEYHDGVAVGRYGGPMIAPSLGSLSSAISAGTGCSFYRGPVGDPSLFIVAARETWPKEVRTSESTVMAIKDTLNTAKDKPFAVFCRDDGCAYDTDVGVHLRVLLYIF